jgi:hypothetical protein
MLPMLSPRYDGKYVAIHRGAPVDADPSRAELVRRFFERFGDAPVYIGFVGPQDAEPPANQVTPFSL